MKQLLTIIIYLFTDKFRSKNSKSVVIVHPFDVERVWFVAFKNSQQISGLEVGRKSVDLDNVVHGRIDFSQPAVLTSARTFSLWLSDCLNIFYVLGDLK